jgi:hypothetical protein
MKRAKRKSQPKKAKTTATQKKKTKKKVLFAPPARILAVAIGDPSNSRTIDSIASLAIPSLCRYYILGMVDHLMNQPTRRLLGIHYVIDYQECFEDGEDFTVIQDPALILCMSTPVMWAAVHFADQLPIVGVTSNPDAFKVHANVCGVNAQRTNNPFTYYTQFKKDLGGPHPKITLLHRTGNPVSEACRDGILQHVNVPVAPVNFSVGSDPRQPIITAINNVNGGGLLVLPVDVFFGFSDTINTTAAYRGLTVFWPAEEFARHGHSHFGSSQVECGRKFGEHADFILTNGTVPTGPARWKTVNPR